MRPGWRSSGAHGLVRGSFVPSQPVRQLRDLTRTRTAITRERTREWQRLEKLLEDAGVKLTSVATDISGVSGRAMLAALIDGVRDPAVLADLARARLREKIPALTEALTGRFSEHHAFLARLHLRLIDQHTAALDELTGRIEVVIEPFQVRPPQVAARSAVGHRLVGRGAVEAVRQGRCRLRRHKITLSGIITPTSSPRRRRSAPRHVGGWQLPAVAAGHPQPLPAVPQRRQPGEEVRFGG